MGARLRDRALGRRTHLTTPTQHPAAAIAAHQDGPLALGRALAHLDRMANAARDRQSAASPAVFRWTWKDAAREWLLIFKEAAAMAHPLLNEATLEARFSEQTKAA